MFLRHLELTNFRSYTRLELDLQACIHIFQGENAQGKTNLLEAIYCLATMKSPLVSHDSQLISWQAADQVLPFTSINGCFTRAGEKHTLEITIMTEPANANKPQGGIRKQARYDGVVQRLIDSIGKLNAVLFLPEDVGLVSGSPGERRRYLDISLCQQNPRYCQQLSRYLRILKQRNALLHQIRDRQAASHDLANWDEQLAAEGSYLLAMRIWFIQALSTELATLYPYLTDSQEHLQLSLKSMVFEDGTLALGGYEGVARPMPEPDSDTAVQYRERFLVLLEQNRREEIARAITVTGPHRDDLRFIINGFDAAEFGSRGQQRSIVLALKLAEAHLMQQQSNESPIILLDDIFSELDRRRSRLLLSALGDVDQVLITTTDLNACDPLMLERSKIWHVANGVIAQLD
ncbi:MAG: DNA replication/repair protein RecF [Chloroflexi bacterium]|nr:DNA replication/repair protein RecF [Chloroflexota bacterium]